MGLDITAYSHLTPVGIHVEEGKWCEDDNHAGVFCYDGFANSYRGLPILGRELNGSGDGGFFEGGCFALTDKTEQHAFRAGSYSGYNHWRADLRRQFIKHDPNPDGPPPSWIAPFYELVWFADNEGCIGPEAAADLLVDFREHADRYSPPHEYYRESYADWTRAFELAAQGGLVEFH